MERQPKNPFHPGEMLLEEFLEPMGMRARRRLQRKLVGPERDSARLFEASEA